jgi:oligosaccharide repeat unit polymerase
MICISFPFLSLVGLKHLANKDKYFSAKTNRRVLWIFYFWIIASAVEFSFFGFLPILSVGNIGETYFDYGIHGLHGLLNAIIITISNIVAYKYFISKKNKYIVLFILILIWPILLLTRQVLISMLIQAGGIYLYSRRKVLSFTKKLQMTLCVVLTLFFFGVLGNFRSGSEALDIVAGISPNCPSFLSDAFLWAYAYLTTPLNNLNHNIEIYLIFDFNPSVIIRGLLPSPLRSNISTENIGFSLVSENLTVSTMHPKYLEAFGIIGSLFAYLLCGYLIFRIYLKFRMSENVRWLFIIVCITHNLFLSFFVDCNLNIIFLSQIMIHYWLGSGGNKQPIFANNFKKSSTSQVISLCFPRVHNISFTVKEKTY